MAQMWRFSATGMQSTTALLLKRNESLIGNSAIRRVLGDPSSTGSSGLSLPIGTLGTVEDRSGISRPLSPHTDRLRAIDDHDFSPPIISPESVEQLYTTLGSRSLPLPSGLLFPDISPTVHNSVHQVIKSIQSNCIIKKEGFNAKLESNNEPVDSRSSKRILTFEAVRMISDYQCTTCMELKAAPCTLACKHSFCGVCLEDQMIHDRAFDQSTFCSLCRAEVMSSPQLDTDLDYSICVATAAVDDDGPDKREWTNRREAFLKRPSPKVFRSLSNGTAADTQESSTSTESPTRLNMLNLSTAQIVVGVASAVAIAAAIWYLPALLRSVGAGKAVPPPGAVGISRRAASASS